MVEFRDVTFIYPGAEEPALDHVSFTALPGQTTAFVGPTGSGKSTLIALILRFYDVTAGQVLVDGIDVREMRQEDLRAKIGYVSQRAILFSGTVESNIRYGDEEMSAADLERAATTAQAMEFIEQLDQGFAHPIAQGGANVSGRAEATALHRARHRPRPGHLHLRRQLLRARLSHGQDAARGAGRGDRGPDRAHRRPARQHHHAGRQDRGSRRRAGRRRRGGTRSCCARARSTAKSPPRSSPRRSWPPPGLARTGPARSMMDTGGLTRERGAIERPADDGSWPARMMAGPAEKPRDFRRTMQRLVVYLRPFWAAIALVLLLAVGSTIFAILGPRILGDVTNLVVERLHPGAGLRRAAGQAAARRRDSAGHHRRRPARQVAPGSRCSRFRRRSGPTIEAMDLSQRPGIDFVGHPAARAAPDRVVPGQRRSSGTRSSGSWPGWRSR